MPDPFISARFPRSARYHPDWILHNVSSGTNWLWLAEWLAEAMDLRPGMRLLDLGCGRATSSIFLAREFDLQVWATDLWFNPSENLQRIRDAGLDDRVFPIHADARSLPFANEFFDAIVSIDSYSYFGTDNLYLQYLLRFLKSGGQIGIASVGLTQEIDGAPPAHLKDWWTHEGASCFHTADWWRRHWERTGLVDIKLADSLPEGWRQWLDWQKVIAPANQLEISAVEADQGKYLGYPRVVGIRKPGVKIEELPTSIPYEYSKQPLLRGNGS